MGMGVDAPDFDGLAEDRGHRWNGWPGAYCLDCGSESMVEICVTSHEHAVLEPERGICIVPCEEGPCPAREAPRD